VYRTRVGDADLELINGRVSVGVASVELRYPDGGAETVPVFERHFLSEQLGDSRPTQIIARDAHGAELARKRVGGVSASGQRRCRNPSVRRVPCSDASRQAGMN